ncbi:MAG: APC family permease [Planctomycetota bacterium]|nr:MAG: APC family permease [Planctomycetota bacterium]
MVTAQNAAEPKSSLRRTLDRTTAMLLTAAMIIGTGLFAALGETADKAGSGLLLAILLSGLVALATGLSAASCGINYPDEGGGFTWSRKFGYPTLGFVAGCAYLGKGIVSTVVTALAFAAYTAQMAEGLPPYLIHVIASAAVRLVTAVNLLGVELNAKMLIGTLIVQLVLLGVFLGFAIPEVQVAHLAPVLGPGVLDVLAGAAIFFWSWDGFMRMAIMASEVKEPRRTIPFAVVGGIVVAAVVFLAVAAVALGVLGADAMRGGDTPNDTPLLTAGALAIGRWGMWVVLTAVWLDTFTEAWGDLLVATRVALAMGKEHELPAWLGVIHPRFRSPHHAVMALGLACIALALFVNLRSVLAVANVFTLVWYSIVLCDALMLPKEQHLVWPVVSWFGLAGCLALFTSLPAWALATGGVTLAALTVARWLVLRYKT